MGGVEDQVPETVAAEHVGDEGVIGGVGVGESQGTQIPHRHGLAESGERAPRLRARRRPARRCRGRGRSPTPAPGARESGRCRLPRAPLPAARRRASSRPLSGPTSSRSPSAVSSATARRACCPAAPTSGSTTARCTPAGTKASASRSTSAPVRTSWRGIAWVRSITRAAGAAPRYHAVADADELVAVAVVGEEADVHRRGRPERYPPVTSATSASMRPSMS